MSDNFQFGQEASLSLVTRLDGLSLAVWHMRHAMWVLPGGKRELGESREHCQERELFEETGLITLLAREVYQGPSGFEADRTLFVYMVHATGEPREVEPGGVVIWLPLREIGIARNNTRSDFYQRLIQHLRVA